MRFRSQQQQPPASGGFAEPGAAPKKPSTLNLALRAVAFTLVACGLLYGVGYVLMPKKPPKTVPYEPAVSVTSNGAPAPRHDWDGMEKGEVGAQLGDTVEVDAFSVTVADFQERELASSGGKAQPNWCAAVALANRDRAPAEVGIVFRLAAGNQTTSALLQTTLRASAARIDTLEPGQNAGGYVCFAQRPAPGRLLLHADYLPDGQNAAWAFEWDGATATQVPQ
jgi:hypothetical protein